jgi:hypothetical protein
MDLESKKRLVKLMKKNYKRRRLMTENIQDNQNYGFLPTSERNLTLNSIQRLRKKSSANGNPNEVFDNPLARMSYNVISQNQMLDKISHLKKVNIVLLK